MPQKVLFIEIDIPREFYSEKTGNKFTNCSICKTNLFENEIEYTIEKAYKNDKYSGKKELIFEYAICDDCQQTISSELSKKSIENIQMYVLLYLEVYGEIEDFENPEDLKNFLQKKLNRCFVYDIHFSELAEYQRIAYFIEDNMILANASPILFGDKAIFEIQELLSQKTREQLEGFKDIILPPEFRETVPDGSLVFI